MNRIALDWGSTRLRAYALSASSNTCGAVFTEMREADTGVFAVQDQRFESTLRALIGDWLDAHQNIEICAAGMIGSANGWAEAPYVRVPAALGDLRAACIEVPFAQSAHRLKIVPGVRQGEGAATDVMRGEEIQIFGALVDAKQQDGVFILPGTHCKWAIVQGGAIVAFRTHYTGELYQWLSTQSSVAKVAPVVSANDDAAFDEGVARALAAPGALLHHMFTLRASVVARERTGAWAANAMRGVLIGHDVAQGIAYCTQYLRRSFDHNASIPTLIGASALCAQYAQVLARAGVKARTLDADVSVNGLAQLFA
jgi:2-dehydro-3-deoxygalactonokinase